MAGSCSRCAGTTWTPGDRHSKYFGTPDAAVEFWEDVNRAKRRGSAADPRRGRITFDEYARQRWEARVARPASGGSGQVRASTAARDASYLRNHALPAFGSWALADIARADVKAWLADLQRTTMAASTVAKNFQLLKACLEEARLDDLIAINPAANIRLPKVEQKRARFLTPEEFQRLEDAIDPRWAIVIPFLADTALRIGELADLLVADVAIDVTTRAGVQAMSVIEARDHLDRIVGATVTISKGAVEIPVRVSGAASRRVSQPPKTEAGQRVLRSTGPAGWAATPSPRSRGSSRTASPHPTSTTPTRPPRSG